MRSTSKLRREDDGKVFRVTMLAHWSNIEADDGETDTVKWYGGANNELYVSGSNPCKGSYVVLSE